MTMEQEQESKDTALAQAAPKPPLALQPRGGFAIQTIDEAWRFANALAGSQFVPAAYRGQPSDCLVAIDLAGRLGCSPLAVLQNTYVVKGRPGMEAKFVISLINGSGLFTDPLDYEVDGTDPDKPDYKVRAFAKRKSTGKILYGPWITWKIVRSERWDTKDGSKWATMAEMMFHYRAASWFANRHCPEVKMGMMTTDELFDIDQPRHVEATDVTPNGVEGLKRHLAQAGKLVEQESQEPETKPEPEPEPMKAEETTVPAKKKTDNDYRKILSETCLELAKKGRMVVFNAADNEYLLVDADPESSPMEIAQASCRQVSAFKSSEDGGIVEGALTRELQGKRLLIAAHRIMDLAGKPEDTEV